MDSNENKTVVESNSEILKELLDENEYNALEHGVRSKIEQGFTDKINSIVVQKALLEATKTNHEAQITQLKNALEGKENEVKQRDDQISKLNKEVEELSQRVAKADEDVKLANESVKKMQYEWQDFKTQRDLACDEKDSLLTMIDRRNSELLELRAERTDLKKNLEAAIRAKIVALENAEEVETMKITLEFKEKRLEQESSILKSQIESLSSELGEKTAELLNSRKSQSAKDVALEAEISEKTEELRIAYQIIADLRESNDKLSQQSRELLEKLAAHRTTSDLALDNFHQELSAQKKLAELYKDMCSENDTKTEKMTNAIDELKRMLSESVEKYGDLEKNFSDTTLRLNEEIAKRDTCIQELKQELENANELLKVAKEENLENVLRNWSPSAAAASKLIKSGMTLTQIYTQYTKVAEELLLEKEENRRLNLAITTIVNEVEQKAPILRQQRLDYEKAVAAAESLSQQMDQMIIDSKVLNEECTEAKKMSKYLTVENERLKKELIDVSRQVCYLVKAVEEARGGVVTHDTAYETGSFSAGDVITRNLVTFSSIQDLQENNQKLLALVRQLSEAHEAVESVSSQDYKDLEAKKQKLEDRVTELVDEMDRQSKMLDLIRSQSATYKKLYQQAMGGNVEVPEIGTPLTPSRSTVGPLTSTPLAASTQQSESTSAMEKKLSEAKKEISDLKASIEKMTDENRSKQKELNATVEKLNSELRESIYKNSKLVAQAEYNEEKSKVLETNLKTAKKQVSALEERNRTISEICCRHEQSLVALKDEVMELQTKLSRAEVQRDNLQQENIVLKAAEARLLKEKEVLYRERVGHSLLMSNLEGLKTALERSESEGRLRLEVQLGEALKECAALRVTLKDEKDNFKELTSSLERQTNTAKERMLEEKALADKARADLIEVRQQLEAKSITISELNEKIRELKNEPVRSVVQSVSSNLDASNIRIKELEKQVRELENESARLHIQLKSAVGGSKQYAEMASSAETNLREITQEHHKCSIAIAKKEKECANRIEEMTSRLRTAEEQVERLKEENEKALQMKTSSAKELSTTLSSVESSLHNKDSELNKLKTEIESLTKQLAEAKEATNNAKRELVEAEAKYSQEVISHSKAIQALDAAQKRLTTATEVTDNLRQERDNALSSLRQKEAALTEQESNASRELMSTIQQMEALASQNDTLHGTLQTLNEQMAILQAKIDGREDINLDTSLNSSLEMGHKAHDELMRIIKYIRKEKDIATMKAEFLSAENTRLKSQLTVAQKQVDELKQTFSGMKETTDVTDRMSARHAELLRKIESLNALTDSNRLLREERNRFKSEIDVLNEKLSKAMEDLVPLQTEVKTLKAQLETLTTENKGLQSDTSRWKVRATQLSERAKTTPEDWRRLTNEREQFSKQLQTEKANNEKLEENLKKLRQECNTLNEQCSELRKQLQNESSEVRRLNDQLVAARQKQAQSDQELVSLRAQVKKLTDDIAKATEEATAKDTQIADLRTANLQIRKLGKKYKTQFEEVSQTFEKEKARQSEEEAKRLKEPPKPAVITEEEQERLRAEGRAEIQVFLTDLESRTSEKLKEVEGRLASANEELETLKKDNETLKTSINEKEERAKQVLKTARTKIAQLTEQKQNLESNLNQYRGNAELVQDENDSKFNSLKAEYDAVVVRFEKERSDQAELLNQERERIKELNQRINQLQRSLDKQKPSTSSQPVKKSMMEPPTANIKPQKQSGTQQSVVYPVFWSSGSETPYASIRPVQTRTVAVSPTSVAGQSSSTGGSSSGLMVAPQQVHTTGNSGEALSSSPTSSHTDYMPATSSATPIRVVVAPVNAQSSQEGEEIVESEQTIQPPTVVAMVMPRVEATAGSPVPDPSSVPSQASSSSSTVTTTQAGHKRPREADGDSSTSNEDDHSKPSPQTKRIRVTNVFHQVTPSEVIDEYQFPTSSQRDQEDDMIILDSEDDGNADEGEAEEPDDEQGFEEDNGEGYEVESYSRDGQVIEMVNFDEGPDIDDENPADGSNEVEIIEDSNEVPNQSGGSQSISGVAAVPAVEEQQQQSSEATSSGNDNASDHVVVSHAASSQTFRTRSVPPLARPQTSMQGYDEGGDDSIVPSTPTLFLARRGDGFGEAVSSPQVPHQRFTFSEPGPGTSRRGDDSGAADDAGTGRSVPTTPLQASPQEMGQDQSIETSVAVGVPHIAVIPEDDIAPTNPLVSGDDQRHIQAEVLDEPETVTIEDDNDGVTSEGEKLPTVGGEPIEEGREAEASEPIARIGGTARRSGRPAYPRRGLTRQQISTVWNEAGSSGLPTSLRTVPTTRGTTPTRGRNTRSSR